MASVLPRQVSFDEEMAVYADTRPKRMITLSRVWDPEDHARGPDLLIELFKYIETSNVRAVEVFFRADADGSGELDFWEFETALQDMGVQMSKLDAELAFESLDEDSTKTISITEFMNQFRRFNRLSRGGPQKEEQGEASQPQPNVTALHSSGITARFKHVIQKSAWLR
jgi:hypothetical protein